jgi:hypothetical protein
MFTGIGLVITLLTVVVIPANMIAQYLISKGSLKVAYPLLMFVYALYFTVETILAFNDPTQISILLFNVVNVWAFSMAFKGMRRMKRESKMFYE